MPAKLPLITQLLAIFNAALKIVHMKAATGKCTMVGQNSPTGTDVVAQEQPCAISSSLQQVEVIFPEEKQVDSVKIILPDLSVKLRWELHS